MKPERYAQVKEVFRAACEREGDGRTRFLEEVGARDPELREEVESLLDHATERAAGTRGAARDAARIPPAEERFLPGTIFAKRYRVRGLLGRGGMGEVYRADDVVLGQSVALKFLPRELAGDPRALEWLRHEVRLARQVTHPNVCRVHDFGEHEGLSFLSMEYVDGEDLTSLVRRIGRLPPGKATEIAREICLGLAAAHDGGVLHRDLKPSNVMLDGRGRARITDFGVAALATEPGEAGGLFGTPAYMAPEQVAGGACTTASDIYSLGVLLYELFTGRHPFPGKTLEECVRLHREAAPARMSEAGVSPEVERVVLRCLDKAPERRPPSARAVAAALPGGDPLAAAVARGETPSPEDVAAAGPSEGMRRGPAAGCAAVFVASLALAAFLHDRSSPLRYAGLAKSPEVLRDRAKSLVDALGYGEEGADIDEWFAEDHAYSSHVRAGAEPVRWERLGESPGAIRYCFRSRPRVAHYWPYSLASDRRLGAAHARGGITLGLDARGRLTTLWAAPRGVEGEEATRTEWARVFEMAGLDPESFTPEAPAAEPRVLSDERRAWGGPSPDDPETRLRVEGAALRGGPARFSVTVAGVPPLEESQTLAPHAPVRRLETILAIVLTVLGAGLAWRNLRRGRADRRGAVNLALFAFGAHTVLWLATGKHSGDTTAEYSLFVLHAGFHLYLGFQLLVFYLAVEPFVRKRWPQTLTPWNRLLEGRFRDPLVGRNLLVGLTAGSVLAALNLVREWIPEWTGPSAFGPMSRVLESLGGPGRALAFLIHDAAGVLFQAMPLLCLLVFLRMLLRREWAAVSVFLGVATLLVARLFATSPGIEDYLFSGVVVTAALWLLSRSGFLSVATAFLVLAVFQNISITLDPASWMFRGSVVGLGALVAIAGWAMRAAVAGTGARAA